MAAAQTYVGACAEAYVLPHRLSQMGDAPVRFVYVENSGHPIEDLLDGSMDDCWQAMIDSIPADAYFAPIAEANGAWTSYHGTVEQVAQAYAKLSGMYQGERMCASFTIMGGSQAYINAVAPWVDIACPSHYDANGTRSGAEIAAAAEAHASGAALPLLLAQTGTVQADKVAWAIEAAEATSSLVIYFDQHQYTQGQWPWEG